MQIPMLLNWLKNPAWFKSYATFEMTIFGLWGFILSYNACPLSIGTDFYQTFYWRTGFKSGTRLLHKHIFRKFFFLDFRISYFPTLLGFQKILALFWFFVLVAQWYQNSTTFLFLNGKGLKISITLRCKYLFDYFLWLNCS